MDKEFDAIFFFRFVVFSLCLLPLPLPPPPSFTAYFVLDTFPLLLDASQLDSFDLIFVCACDDAVDGRNEATSTRRPNRHHQQWDGDEEAERADDTISVCRRLWAQSVTRAFKLDGSGDHRCGISLVSHSFDMHGNTHKRPARAHTRSALHIIIIYSILHTDIYYVVNVFKPDLAYDLIRYNVSFPTMSSMSSCVRGICECDAVQFSVRQCARTELDITWGEESDIGHEINTICDRWMNVQCAVYLLRAYEVAMGRDKLFQ